MFKSLLYLLLSAWWKPNTVTDMCTRLRIEVITDEVRLYL